EQRARGIGGVGCVNAAARQPPQQIGIDRTEGEFSARSTLARSGNIVEQPGELGSGEIRIEQEAGFGAEEGFVAFGFELCTESRGTPVLPDDGAMHGPAAGAVPQQSRLALIGYTDRGNIACGGANLIERRATSRKRGRPQVFGLVFDLTVGGKMLWKFL